MDDEKLMAEVCRKIFEHYYDDGLVPSPTDILAAHVAQQVQREIERRCEAALVRIGYIEENLSAGQEERSRSPGGQQVGMPSVYAQMPYSTTKELLWQLREVRAALGAVKGAK